MDQFWRVRLRKCCRRAPTELEELAYLICSSTSQLEELEGLEQCNLVQLFGFNEAVLSEIVLMLYAPASSIRYRAMKLLLSLSYDKRACELMLYGYGLDFDALCFYDDYFFVEQAMTVFTNIVYGCPQSADFRLFYKLHLLALQKHQLLNCFMYLMLSFARCSHYLSYEQVADLVSMFFSLSEMMYQQSSVRQRYEYSNTQLFFSILQRLCDISPFYGLVTEENALCINRTLREVKGPDSHRCFRLLADYLLNFDFGYIFIIVNGLKPRDLRIDESYLRLLDYLVELAAESQLSGAYQVVLRYFFVDIRYERILQCRIQHAGAIGDSVRCVFRKLFLQSE